MRLPVISSGFRAPFRRLIFPANAVKNIDTGDLAVAGFFWLPGAVAVKDPPHFVRAGTETARVADVVES